MILSDQGEAATASNLSEYTLTYVRMQTFRNWLFYFLRRDIIKFVFSHRNDSLRSDIYPRNSCLMMPKSCLMIKMIFLIQNYPPPPHTYFSHFFKKKNFYSLFLDIVLPTDSDKVLNLVSHCPICFFLLYMNT